MVGVVTEPLGLSLIPMVFGQLSVSASQNASPTTLREMLDFSARHEIAPVTEHFPMSRVNDAIEHLRSGKARYRIVLDHD